MRPVATLLLSLSASAATLAAVNPDANTTPNRPIEFNRDIRPILSDNCFYCHGNDASHRKAKLRLDIREEALAKEAFLPGTPEKSALIERILSTDPDDIMPPPDSHKKLSDSDKEILKRWIQQGAPYQKHWSYEKPVKAPVPAGQNAVDVLVQKRLAEIGLQHSPEADRRTLIRRLYLDLLGLPPSPGEVNAFEQDSSPTAWTQLVDKVLANPHFGERMAIGWLDVVRFADTVGYHADNPRNIAPYRDWVIQSFNKNKRFDRFTQEQIAGDLLPDASQETRVGSAFNRLLLTTQEFGAQAKDYELRMLTDRVRAVGAAWLGQTTGCAQCHDHKFDPFSTRDFYSLGAFFADIKEGIIAKREDGMVLGTPQELNRLEAAEEALEREKKRFETIRPQLEAAQKQWEEDLKKHDLPLPELRPDAKPAPADLDLAKRAKAALSKEPKKRRAEDKEALQKYFYAQATDLFVTERKALEEAQSERDATYNPMTKCLVSVSSPQKRTVRILARGNWMDESGEIVKPALPHYLPAPKIEDRELTRLDLANWLVSRDNPLTARTVMNRLWKQLFGTGLSKILDDLGAQGELPLNQALLDWLACEFMESGWDFKHMVRSVVLSATYRQTSNPTPALNAADPYNRELARQSAFRLDAELVRDNALAISGLLVSKIGGPSVKPYQPAGYWENLNFPPRTYPNDKGEDQYRRGLYTWWQRTFLHPSLLAFDAPNREECCAERNRSNIPQQALVLLNDPTYVEASRTFAARVLRDCQGTDSERIRFAWKLALQRMPQPEEEHTLSTLLQARLASYEREPKAAEDLLKVGHTPPPANIPAPHLAAWTHVSRVLLNLHETITRD